MGIEKDVAENLLVIIGVYREATGFTMVTCSVKFYGNGYFFQELKIGKVAPNTRKLDEILKKIRAAWPAGVAWPTLRPIQM